MKWIKIVYHIKHEVVNTINAIFLIKITIYIKKKQK